jgi:hypothetical protein
MLIDEAFPRVIGERAGLRERLALEARQLGMDRAQIDELAVLTADA